MILSVTYYSELPNTITFFYNVILYQLKSFIFYKVQTINITFSSKMREEVYIMVCNIHYMRNMRCMCYIQMLFNPTRSPLGSLLFTLGFNGHRN